MKYLLVSDIHGDYKEVEFILKKFNELKCKKIICLGDFLYHGPRNALPKNYDPKKCVELLNQYKDKIIAIKGNCDAEVDEMVLNFKFHKKLSLNLFHHHFVLLHGHHLDKLKNLKKGDIVLYGHYHIFDIHQENAITYINPGSISIPRNNLAKTYGLIDENGIFIYDKENKLVLSYKFSK